MCQKKINKEKNSRDKVYVKKKTKKEKNSRDKIYVKK